jgi:thymidylate synthase
MEIEADSLDDVLVTLYPELLERADGNAARRGTTKEKIGVLLRIAKPRARLSQSFSRGKPFSA